MTEEENEQHLALLGPYEAIRTPEGVRLKRDYSYAGDFPDAEHLVFENTGVAKIASDIISLPFQDSNISTGFSKFTVPNVMRAEVSGGKDGKCIIYRLDDEGKEVGESMEAKSPQEIANILTRFFGEKR